jgi:flavin reductase (DIM6/NTAB) family NADH-FMN oxidoreductase RutF
MHYDALAGDHGLPHDPFKALVVPRPIGWICALSAKGEVNLSPYSFFNAVSDRPHMVAFASDGEKDALVFAEETGEFTCSLATWDLRDAMNITAKALPRGESEMAAAGLAAAPSRFVKPPRVAASPAALECKWLQTVPLVPLGGGPARYRLVIGQVVGVYIDDRFVRNGRVDSAAMKAIARGGYHDYFLAGETFELVRPG